MREKAPRDAYKVDRPLKTEYDFAKKERSGFENNDAVFNKIMQKINDK